VAAAAAAILAVTAGFVVSLRSERRAVAGAETARKLSKFLPLSNFG